MGNAAGVSVSRAEAKRDAPDPGLASQGTVRSGAGVGVLVKAHQPCAVEAGIALGGGQAGMSQELLNGPEIGTVGQEMRCETMTKGVRCGAFSEPQYLTERLNVTA